MRNPLIDKDTRLREIMTLRRHCHKAFDSIKCDIYTSILDDITEDYKEKCKKEEQPIFHNDHPKFKFDHLVIREHVFSFYELDHLSETKLKLEFLLD